MHPYLPHTKEEIALMLSEIGAESIEELFSEIDNSLINQRPLELPEAQSELAIRKHFKAIIDKNESADMISFAGGGMYEHDIPESVGHLTSRSEFYSAYTPYQPEISQGTLQSIFEYQSMICQLTDMDASNASHYDGATATAEAVMMAHKTNKRNKIMMSQTLNPEVQRVVETYCKFKGIEIIMIESKEGLTDTDYINNNLSKEISSVVIQSPNYFGLIEDISGLSENIHEFKTLLILHMNPIAMSVFKAPGEMGVDIAVGDGQVLGNPMNYGGPSLGFMATNEKFMRKLPGRIVGEAIDVDGNVGYVLTLQAREQHIRRDKATSNITSNQALNALSATIYLSLLGPAGIRDVALKSMANCRYLVENLMKLPGVEMPFKGVYFNEIVLRIPNAKELYSILIEHNICLGILLEQDDQILIAVTEVYDKNQLDQSLEVIKKLYLEIKRNNSQEVW